MDALASSALATAVKPPSCQVCASCGEANHPGTRRCACCGVAFPLGHHDAPAPPVSPAVAVTLMAPGPLSTSLEVPPRSTRLADDPPMSRRVISDAGSDAMAAAPIADPLIGVVVAERYRILELLGRGGMGIVYKVEHIRIGKLLAMKLLTGELSRNPEVVRRFKQEALTASKLSSPNTVQVFDFGVSEGLTYLVMELIAGEDLARVLRNEGPMPFARLAKVVIQVCTSLSEAHQKGIVHRDVKPENIMLLRARDATDVAKMLDFGLAKLREGAELNDVTSQGAIVGTPYFMAPEQIRGEAVDARADIYALGALMYRALTGHYPFNGPTPMSVFTKHLSEAPVPPNERAPELAIPAGACAIVLRALQKDAADRHQKVEELQAALVAEVRAAGTASVEVLLDSGQVLRLTRVAVAAAEEKGAAQKVLATRDEVERYERKLRRKRWGALVSMGVVLAAVATGGYELFVHERALRGRGRELEPNDTASRATPLPYGAQVTGYLGKRLDATHGDRDFFAVDIPAAAKPEPALVKIQVTPLPNFAMCTLMYRQGFDTPAAQYCVGRPARELSIPALRLEAGRYFFAVMQDLDPYGGPAPFIHENISDAYSIGVGPGEVRADVELEPNDRVASANPIAPGDSMSGTLAWSRDEDVFCVAKDAPFAIRWKVRDQGRAVGEVLEATLLRGSLEESIVRIHAGMGKPTSTDVLGPWTSERVPEGDEARCLRLRASTDPWSGGTASAAPAGGSDAYVVEVE